MEPYEIVPGARILVPLAASTLYIRPYEFVVKSVEPMTNPHMLRLQGRPVMTKGGAVFQPVHVSRSVRVRFEHCQVITPSTGPLCVDPTCWEAAVAVDWAGQEEDPHTASLTYRCGRHPGGPYAVPLLGAGHEPRAAGHPTGGVVVDCVCGWAAAVPPDADHTGLDHPVTAEIVAELLHGHRELAAAALG